MVIRLRLGRFQRIAIGASGVVCSDSEFHGGLLVGSWDIVTD